MTCNISLHGLEQGITLANNEFPVQTKVCCGVPLGSVLGPHLLFMSPLSDIVRKHSVDFCCYVDDTQQYLSMKSAKTNQIIILKTCLKLTPMRQMATHPEPVSVGGLLSRWEFLLPSVAQVGIYCAMI